MKRSPHRYPLRVVLGLGVIAFAAWVVPTLFSAEPYRRRLEMGLERALRRPVTFGAMGFRLLPRPRLVIENAVVHEDPAFGSEPFARVGGIQCDLRWRSLWHTRLEFSRLYLERASFNVVRNPRGEWNVEDLLVKSGMVAPSRVTISEGKGSDLVAPPQLDLDGARINFKIGADKKAFALKDVQGQIAFGPDRRALRFGLRGNPLRAGFSLPTPGPVELDGEWSPGQNLEGPLDAWLRTRSALLYDWIPLLTGQNPEIYGVVDADIHLAGSIHLVKVKAEGRLSQIRRWEQLPPSGSLTFRIDFRGQVDRRQGRTLIESADVSFGDSRVHLSGSLDHIATLPELDLTLAVERSRLEDFVALGRRLGVSASSIGISGRVNGLLTLQGPWSSRCYGGFLIAQAVRLTTPRASFPVSDLGVTIDNGEARLAPATLSLTPHTGLLAEGSLELAGGVPRYELTLSGKGVSLKDLMSFGHAIGTDIPPGLDAQGVVTLAFRSTGLAWPLTHPTLNGRAELRQVRLLVAGLTEPVEVRRARIQFNADQVIVEPVEAVVETTVFSGRLERHSERGAPWLFDLRADHLSLEEGARWFDVLGLSRPVPLFERLSGLRSLTARRVAASNLLGALNARGQFAVPALTYRALTLKDVRTAIEVSRRTIRVTMGRFRAGEGRGHGTVQLDLNIAPARLSGEVELAHANLRSLAFYLPEALGGVKGLASGLGRFETRGLTRQEMSASLAGEATLRLEKVSFGRFDPVESLVRETGAGDLEPARGEASLRSAVVTLELRGPNLAFKECSLDLGGAMVQLAGRYALNQGLNLDVRADLRHLRRQWNTNDPDSRHDFLSIRLEGPLDKLVVVPERKAFAHRSDE